MKMLYGVQTAVVFLLALASNKATAEDVFVDVEQGRLRGSSELVFEDEFTSTNVMLNKFLGIPFAEAPERFKAPVPKGRWDGTWDATYFRPSCLQGSLIWDQNTSEDCLYLNVYAPQATTTDELPVMVFIYGGGYNEGGVTFFLYDGTYMSAFNNVIVVTINYRVGVPGFLWTGDKNSLGNLGLWDQNKALKWIKRNIQAFGGDSDRITIYGESAGSGSVSLQLVSKQSDDYFHRGIMESGTLYSPWGFVEDNEKHRELAFKVGTIANCTSTTTEDLMDCLSRADLAKVTTDAYNQNIRLLPGIDGTFLTDKPENLFKSGQVKERELIIGYNADEATGLALSFEQNFDTENPTVSRDQMIEYQESWSYYQQFHTYPTAKDIVIASVQQEYFDWSRATQEDYNFFQTFVDLNGDENYFCPTKEFLDYWTKYQTSPVYMYNMTHVPSRHLVSLFLPSDNLEWLGATHGEELPYVFGIGFSETAAALGFVQTDEEKQLSVNVMKYWSNFAKTGNPNHESLNGQVGDLSWPEYTSENQDYLIVSTTGGVGSQIRPDQCHLWNSYLPKLQSYFAPQEDAQSEWRSEFQEWQKDIEEWRVEFEKYKDGTPCA